MLAYGDINLRTATLRLTSSHYLYEGMASINEQMMRLYDNALKAYIDLGLEIGKALNARANSGADGQSSPKPCPQNFFVGRLINFCNAALKGFLIKYLYSS